jgi:hypothetical protein
LIDRTTYIKPPEITVRERLEFIRILEENLPERVSLHRKLNQNITPMPSEILRCMRLSLTDEDDENEEEGSFDENYDNWESNKYELVIEQEACTKAIAIFKSHVDQIEEERK